MVVMSHWLYFSMECAHCLCFTITYTCFLELRKMELHNQVKSGARRESGNTFHLLLN
jgi:hypothetical protein